MTRDRRFRIHKLISPAAFVAYISLLLASPSALQTSDVTRLTAAVQYHGFSFVAGGCELPSPYCEIRQPKSWSDGEVSVITRALDEIAVTPTGLRIIQRVQKDGFTTFRRYTQYWRIENDQAVPNSTAKGVTRYQVKAVDFNDAFFRCETARDRFSGTPGLSVPTIIVLHELFHALDREERRYSNFDEFRRLVGFRIINGRLSLVARSQDEVVEWAKYVQQQDELERMGRCDAVFEVQRRYGLEVVKRLPSMQAVERPDDAFAEIGAYLVLDRERAETYLDAAVRDYFLTRVFVE